MMGQGVTVQGWKVRAPARLFTTKNLGFLSHRALVETRRAARVTRGPGTAIART